jgi:leucyl aminopeptidase
MIDDSLRQTDIELHVDQGSSDWDAHEAIVKVVSASGTAELSETILRTHFPKNIAQDVLTLMKKREFEAKSQQFFAMDYAIGRRLYYVVLGHENAQFDWLTIARKVTSELLPLKPKSILLDLIQLASVDGRKEKASIDLSPAPRAADAFVSALGAGLYKFPKYKTAKADAKNTSKSSELIVTICTQKSALLGTAVERAALRGLTLTTSGTNLVRWLAKRAGNDLNCKTYRDFVSHLCKSKKLKFEYLGHDQLVKLKAGCFLAVVQGSAHQDYGIAKITYTPKKAKKHIAIVGKGLVYDTGGHSLKPSQYMLGMHGDMAGSAVALALVNVAAALELPVKLTAYLAIADNMIGPKSYKPNDVITAMNGTTVEIIDTDAEGRMVLSDTLHLASREKPDALMDFATLTGACVRAIGTTYAGVFSNRPLWVQELIAAGQRSGERVWPFPMDKDFADCLDSTSADTKQCREKGGVDHIEASQFLSRFVDAKVDWLHVDLSSIENAGGLAHVPSDETGFGVRFGVEWIESLLRGV